MDRAALDVALELGIPCGGWCPKSRKAEDGTIDKRYPLQETPSAEYAQRTEWNVRDSDGTLILTQDTPLSGGTAQTVAFANQMGRPFLVVDLAKPVRASDVREWMKRSGIRVLNVAGPREHKSPGMYRRAAAFLREVFGALTEREVDP